MKQYDIYKSDGGYRVARGMLLGYPLKGASPWFRNRGLAASWRMRALEQARQRVLAPEYPASYRDADLAYFDSLIARPQTNN